MSWRTLCNRPDLRNLSLKIELNGREQMIMSPVKVYHSAHQEALAALLRLHRQDGKILSECAVQTRLGTKGSVASWASCETDARVKDEAECSVAPEICIENLSTSNTRAKVGGERVLYFERGAREVWLCDPQGNFECIDSVQKLERLMLFPDFSARVGLDT